MTCPVALYTATSAASDVHFHLINPKTNNRIRMITTDPDDGPVNRSDLVKGYQISKDRYVLLTDDDIKLVQLESTKTIDIERFVPGNDIDRIYWDNPYYLAPDGKLAQEAFAVIREAMRDADQIAIGRVVISTRERLLALEPRDKGILAYSLRSDDEVRSAEEVFDGISGTKPDKSMIEIARKIIEQKEGKFVDRYESALKKLIAQKEKGHEPIAAEEPENSNVIDLMAALKASLGGKTTAPSAKPTAKAKPVAKMGQGAKPKTRKAG